MKVTINNRLNFANKRIFLATLLLVLPFFVLFLRIWFLQIYKGEHYSKLSEYNMFRKIDIPAGRGVIFDRHGELILGNRRMYDLVYIPQYVVDSNKTLNRLSSLLNLSRSSFDRPIRRHRGSPKFTPIVIRKNLSLHERILVESYKEELPGIHIQSVPKRDYKKDLPVHLIGYLGEHRPRAKTKDPYRYLPGDLEGKQGIEKVWESSLRGGRGFRYLQVDALGREVQTEKKDLNYLLPEEKAASGLNLFLTIDWEVQKTAQEAFEGKNGAVVVLDPRNGEILALVSSPSFSPELFQKGLSVEKWQTLLEDPFKPLFDKTTGGLFSPGSLFKPLIGLAALEEGLISYKTKHHCGGHMKLGSRTFHCHNRWGHGKMTLKGAMLRSCDVFFYHLGTQLGIDRIEKYAKDFYLGQKLELGLNKEYSGLIPSAQWKWENHRASITSGDLANLAIGQGALLMTPLQMASFFGTLANLGSVWRPYVVSHLTNADGEVVFQNKPELLHEVSLVRKSYFKEMREILYESVEDSKGTGRRAKIEGIPVAGKTGSVQVVSLKRNRNRKSASSMKWQEHAMFAAFSPVKKPEIVVLVVSENDPEGGGGAQSAPIAKDILEAYWKLKKSRKAK